jgi:hypothetical protein
LSPGGLAVIGILVMRNPLLLARLAPGEKGYYQRMVLDRFQRIQMRVLGMIVSFFGLVILTAGLNGMLKLEVLQTISSGFLVLLWLSFIAAIGFGLIYFVVRLVGGRASELFTDWFEMRQRQVELGPTFRESLPAQPVDATPYDQLPWQYFPSKIDLYGSPQSEPKQGFALFELTPANEISLVDS